MLVPAYVSGCQWASIFKFGETMPSPFPIPGEMISLYCPHLRGCEVSVGFQFLGTMYNFVHFFTSLEGQHCSPGKYCNRISRIFISHMTAHDFHSVALTHFHFLPPLSCFVIISKAMMITFLGTLLFWVELY